MSENTSVLREYVAELSDDDLKFLEGRLNQRLSGDIAEVLNFLEKNSKVDFVLSKGKSADDLYDAVDLIQEIVGVEVQNRPRLVEATR